MIKTFIPIPQDLNEAEILLINADFSKNELGLDTPHENHLGLLRLASYLDSKNIPVQVLNTTGMSKGTDGPEKLADWLNEKLNNYKVLGFYVTSWNIPYIIRIIQKLNSPHIPLYFGGPLPSAAPEKMIEYLSDFGLTNMGLVQGYGEFILEKMLINKDNLADVEGVWSYQHGKMIKGCLQRHTEDEMSDLPVLNNKYNTYYQLYYKPALQTLDLGDYTLEFIFGSFGLDSNHGCPFNCSYCSVPLLSRRVDNYSPIRVVDEIENTAKQTGIFMFTFTYSNNMFYSREWIREFCKEIMNRKIDSYVVWNGYHHLNILDLLTQNDFQMMKEAGSSEIVIGVQSIEKNICDLFHRPKDTFEKVKRILTKVKKSGQSLVVDYITNVPGENNDAIETFYTFCMEHGIECRNYDLKLYPGTELACKNLDFTNHEITPITGEIPPELGVYLLVNKNPNPRLAELQLKLHQFNQDLHRKRIIRLGKYFIKTQKYAERLLKYDIPKHAYIPEKVKRAFTLILNELLYPKDRKFGVDECNLKSMLKSMMDKNAPPVLKKMKERMMNEMGKEKFLKLCKRHGI